MEKKYGKKIYVCCCLLLIGTCVVSTPSFYSGHALLGYATFFPPFTKPFNQGFERFKETKKTLTLMSPEAMNVLSITLHEHEVLSSAQS